MNRRRLRCVGGPEHGKFIDLPPGRDSYRVALPPDYSSFLTGDAYEAAHAMRVTSVEYRVQKVELGNNTRIEVLGAVPQGYDEFFRRVADIIEGTHERQK